MDTRTWQALTSGQVDLPRRRIHAGIWFRLLRTVIDELGAGMVDCGTAQRISREVWQRAGYPVRAGQSVWRPFEAQTPQTQERTLEASAIAMHLLETGDLTGRGDAAALFLPEPDVPLDPDPPRQTHRSLEDRWRELADAVKAAIEDAKQNPNSANQLFDLMTMYPRGDAATHNQRIRANFEELGIPLDFLSQ